MQRIQAIDSIRFVCAMVVLIGHYGYKIPALLNADAGGIYKIARGIMLCLFNGPAAVIVFFIVSGFCIHYPYKNKGSVSLVPFYSKRLLRIGVPAIVALCIYYVVKIEVKAPNYAVFWSIICELLYYLLYPFILYVRNFVGISRILIFSYLASLLLIVFHVNELRLDSDYMALGLSTWIIGLPCWLLGCWLAENYQRFPVIPFSYLWVLRIFIFAISVGLKLTKFHIHEIADPIFASYCITLNLFAVLACAWVGFEVSYYIKHQPNKLLERAGQWSYSLYLIHPVVPYFFSNVGLKVYPKLAGVDYLVLYLTSLLVSYLFFMSIERPSHRLAANVGKFFLTHN